MNPPPLVEPLRKCAICNEPLSDWQQPIAMQRIHKEGPCILCKYCNKEVGRDRIFQCLDKEDPISHTSCYDKFIEESFLSRPVTITQGHLNYLNKLIQFAYRPNMARSIEENMGIAEEISNKNIVDMSMEEKFAHMKMMQAAAANVSIVLGKNKDAIRLKVEREDIERHVKIRDLGRVLSAEELRTLQENERVSSIEKKRITGDPVLRAREKLIDNYQKMMGFTREGAIEFIDKQKKMFIESKQPPQDEE